MGNRSGGAAAPDGPTVEHEGSEYEHSDAEGKGLVDDAESDEEFNFLREVTDLAKSYTSNAGPTAWDPAPIFEFWQKGVFDQLARQTLKLRSTAGDFDKLLYPGRSLEMMATLASIFANDSDFSDTRIGGFGAACRFDDYTKSVFCPDAVIQLLELGATQWAAAPNVIELVPVDRSHELIIVGDTHGQLRDVLWMFFKYGPPSSTRRYLFNGDIVDRGGHALEILLLLIAIKRDNPDSVHILRGNHEDPLANRDFGFVQELHLKFGEADAKLVLNACKDLYMVLPLMAIVSLNPETATKQSRFCVLHGGIPVNLSKDFRVDDLRKIKRQRESVLTKGAPEDLEETKMMFQMLWNDPKRSEKTRSRGLGAEKFTKQHLDAFLQHHQFDWLVRSHQVPKTLKGFDVCFSRKCYTIFSASNYCGTTGNLGGVMICKEGQVKIEEHWAPSWSSLKNFMAKMGNSDAERKADARLEDNRGLASAFISAESYKRPKATTRYKVNPFCCSCARRSRQSVGVNVVVESASYSSGNFAKFTVNGKVVPEESNGFQRGLRFVVLDKHTNEASSGTQVVKQRVFDTVAEEQEIVNMVEWIQNLDPCSVVLVAAKDSASGGLWQQKATAAMASKGGYQALRSLGWAGEPFHFRESFAFVGVKGHTGIEQRSTMTAVTLEVGQSQLDNLLIKYVVEIESHGYYDKSAACFKIIPPSHGKQSIRQPIVIPNSRTLRGLNFVTLADDLAPSEPRNFDTCALEQDVQDMIKFIRELKEGTLVLCAAKDSPIGGEWMPAATNAMKQGGYDALKKLGLRETEFQWRESFAFAAVKGGKMKESRSTNHAVTLQLTLNELNSLKRGIASPLGSDNSV